MNRKFLNAKKNRGAKAMSTGRLEVICGEDSSGKTAMALGRALQALTEQKSGSAKANGAGTQSIPV